MRYIQTYVYADEKNLAKKRKTDDSEERDQCRLDILKQITGMRSGLTRCMRKGN